MKKLTLLLISCICCQIATAQWNLITSPVTTNLLSVYAINDSCVAASGATNIVRSVNGGASWTTPLSVGGSTFSCIASGSTDYWYSLTSNSTALGRVGNPIGVSYVTGAPTGINGLCFTTDSTAFAVGNTGLIEITNNAGVSWATQISGTVATLTSVCFTDTLIGYAVGTGGKIIKTIDRGTNWTQLTSGTTSNLYSVHFPCADTGYAVGALGIMLRTVDAGATWTMPYPPFPNDIRGVFFTSPTNGYNVGAGGTIMTTTNAGNSWSNMSSPTTNLLYSVHFSSPTTGWAVGANGVILKFGSIPTSIRNPIAENISTECSPNPFNDGFHIYVSGNNDKNVLVKISDITGKIIYSEMFENFGFEKYIRPELLKPGMYFAEISSGEFKMVKKMVKE